MTAVNSPLFCLTSDVDWTSDFALRDFLTVVTSYGITPTVFATHRSAALTEFEAAGAIELGIHPNFLPGSSHGADPSTVIDAMCREFPQARSYRSHWFFDHTQISREFVARGFRYDSNLCLYAQPDLVPLRHNSGLVRFPVFWEDDVHWSVEHDWDLDRHVERFLTPGLKILSVHPFFFAANIPSQDYYLRVKPHIGTLDQSTLGQVRHDGPGTRTFVIALLERLRARGERFYPLSQLYRMVPVDGPPAASSITPAGRETPHTDEEYERYWRMSDEERQAFVKADFDQRNPHDPYSTSRDYHARELEIDSIGRALAAPGRLLDLGCGNGHTLISLARQLEGWDLRGVDFSEPLVAGACAMRDDQAGALKSQPDFVVADAVAYVRDLPDASVDYVVTERFIQNLPSRDSQRRMIADIYRVLAPGGKLLLCEGSDDGFTALNELRTGMGLPEIPATSKDNVSAIRFGDTDLEAFARQLGFAPAAKLGYSTFFIIARVLHPLLVAPQSPRFDARINELARAIQQRVPYTPGYGSNVLWVFDKPRA